MNWLVYHIVSGQAFFTGVFLLILAAVSSTRSRPIFRRITALSFRDASVGTQAGKVSDNRVVRSGR